MPTPRKAQRQKLASEGKAQKKSVRGAGRGAYPTDTHGRAVAAKGRATQALKGGRISKATELSIDRRADRELGKTKRKRQAR